MLGTIIILAVFLLIGLIAVPPSWEVGCSEAARWLENDATKEVPIVGMGYQGVQQTVSPQADPCTKQTGVLLIPAYMLIVYGIISKAQHLVGPRQ